MWFFSWIFFFLWDVDRVNCSWTSECRDLKKKMYLNCHWFFFFLYPILRMSCITINCKNIPVSHCVLSRLGLQFTDNWKIPKKSLKLQKTYSQHGCNKTTVYKSQRKVTNFIFNKYFKIEWTLISKQWTGIVMTLLCVLWTSYVLNVKNVTTAFF